MDHSPLPHAHDTALHAPHGDHRRALGLALALTVTFLGVQVLVGFWSGSLAVLSDAGHMATDAVGLTLALCAAHLARRGTRHPSATFGLQRIEILAALANALLLVVVGASVLWAALGRIGDPVEVDPRSVLLVGVLGATVNLVAFRLLRPGAEASLNVRGAALEVLADLLGSIAVVSSAVLTWLLGWAWIDAATGAAIAVFVLPRALRLGAAAVRVLLQVAPGSVDVASLRAALEALEGVQAVHDLHVWTLTSGQDVLSAHLVHAPGGADVLDAARGLASERFGLTHVTFQVEAGPGRCSAVER